MQSAQLCSCAAIAGTKELKNGEVLAAARQGSVAAARHAPGGDEDEEGHRARGFGSVGFEVVPLAKDKKSASGLGGSKKQLIASAAAQAAAGAGGDGSDGSTSGTDSEDEFDMLDDQVSVIELTPPWRLWLKCRQKVGTQAFAHACILSWDCVCTRPLIFPRASRSHGCWCMAT
jgi:hypothetical protein